MENNFIVSIEKDADGSYIAYNTNGKGYALIGRGQTISEAKADFAASMQAVAASETEREGKAAPILTAEPEYRVLTVKQILSDIYEDINWAYLAQNYFGKSRSWLYHKFSGTNNGKADDFSDVDRERLKGALADIAYRIRQTADRL